MTHFSFWSICNNPLVTDLNHSICGGNGCGGGYGPCYSHALLGSHAISLHVPKPRGCDLRGQISKYPPGVTPTQIYTMEQYSNTEINTYIIFLYVVAICSHTG